MDRVIGCGNPPCQPVRSADHRQHRFATFHGAADYRVVRARRENQRRHSRLTGELTENGDRRPTAIHFQVYPADKNPIEVLPGSAVYN